MRTPYLNSLIAFFIAAGAVSAQPALIFKTRAIQTTAGAPVTELRSPVLEPAAADIRDQLAGLVYPGFLAATGTRRLPALARYLRAMQYRLDKLPDNPGRDAQQMAVAHRVEDAYRDALAALPAAERSIEAAREIGWQIQELRVSLFAQTVGTQGPVSERRILTAIDHLT